MIEEKKTKSLWIIFIILLPILFSLCTTNPEGTSIESPYYDVSQIQFLYDLTYEKEGKTVHEQRILAEELAMIKEAKQFVLLDFFLFNDAYNKKGMPYPDSVQQITEALIAKKSAQPEIEIVFITDPINGFYGAYTENHLKEMRKKGILVVETDLNRLKDSNYLYSGYYRTFVLPFGTEGTTWIPNPLDRTQPKIHIRSLLKLANFKANHRKLIVTERSGLIASANPHDASSYHSNVAVKVHSPVIQDIIEGERALAKFSGTTLPKLKYEHEKKASLSEIKVRYLTEKRIYNALVKNIDAAEPGDSIQIGAFYISDFDMVKALERAGKRGVSVYIVADPNKDAFGIEKDGSPNRTVLSDLRLQSDHIQIRWYDTDGEQYHTKMAFFSFREESVTILGSANYTRRNLKDYNLECDMEIVTGKEVVFSQQVEAYFHRLWNNINGQYTVDFEAYSQDRAGKRMKYWFQESTGLCTY